jgi:hypothetical protein
MMGADLIESAIVFKSRFGHYNEIGVTIHTSRSVRIIARISNEYQWNGFSVLRQRDLETVESLEGDERFSIAAKHFGLVVSRNIGFVPDLSSIGSFLRGYPKDRVLILKEEATNPKGFWLGFIESIGSRSLSLLTVSPDCVSIENEKALIKNISRVDFGGRYESIVTWHRAKTFEMARTALGPLKAKRRPNKK